MSTSFNGSFANPQDQPCWDSPLTTACGLCAHYNLDICRIAKTPYNYITNRCPPIAADLFNNYQIIEPTILLVCLVAGITGMVSGVRIYKNRETRRHFKYAVTFIGFGVCMVLTMLARCFFYPVLGTATDYSMAGYDTPGNIALVTVLVALSCCVGLSLIFDGLVDVAIIRDGCWLCIVIMAISYLLSFIIIIALAVTNNPNTLQFFTFFLPLFGGGVYFLLELINVLRRGSKKGALWLALALVLFLAGCFGITLLHDPLCQKIRPFDGVFFYYLFLDLTFTVLYKFFVTIKEEELDDDETPMLCYC